ncbi:MAG: hypothetical protein NUW22_02200 [Acidobacteria bacterium]|nr:hypothetical protein [Acidobacteriota bacterium]
MSGKLVGIGIVGIGCLAGAAVGGYFVLQPGEADIAAITPIAVQVEARPMPSPEPVAVPVAREAAPTTRTPVRSRPAVETATPEPIEEPVVTPPVQAAPPVVAPPTSPAPVAAEPQRYVPDPPLPAAPEVAEPQRIQFEELTVERHSVIGIRLDEAISTRTARVEDRVSATVSRDVTAAGRVAIPAGVRLEGNVVLVEHGGKFRERPRLGLRFDRMILTDGTRVSLKTDTIYREGDSPSADATAKMGAGAVAGAILGGLLGGKKGAAIGTAAGAAGGAATVMRGDGNESSLPAGAPLTVRLTDDVTVTIQR